MTTIVCFAKSDYDIPLLTNRQQIMNRLAVHNRVLYVGGTVSFCRQLYELGVVRAVRALFGPDMRKGNLSVYRERFFLPYKIMPLKFAWKAYAVLNAFFLRRLLKCEGSGRYFLWIYTPEAYFYCRLLPSRTGICYDCVDEYKEQPSYAAAYPRIETYERRLLALASCVFTTTSHLYLQKSPYNPVTHFIANVADFAVFNPAAGLRPGCVRTRVGFWGALDTYKVDFPLLLHVVTQNPGMDFEFVGPVGLCESGGVHPADGLRRQPNVTIRPPVAQHELVGLITEYSALIIPYRENEYTRNCFPLKFYEYLATGRPVVVSGLPELRQFSGMVHYAESAQEFCSALRTAVTGDTEEARRRRIALAAEHTWESRISAIVDVIRSTCPEAGIVWP